MATIQLNNSPVHSDSIITAIYGDTGSMWSCGFHTGLDFASYSGESNPMLYSCCIGEVVEVNLTPSASLGNNVVIRDTNGKYFRYCHMVTGSVQVSVGDQVNLSTPIGQMGDTGNVTGIHLHLEYATTQGWNCNTFLDPAGYFGVTFARGDIVEYSGSPTPPTHKGNAKKWLMAKAKRINIRF